MPAAVVDLGIMTPIRKGLPDYPIDVRAAELQVREKNERGKKTKSQTSYHSRGGQEAQSDASRCTSPTEKRLMANSATGVRLNDLMVTVGCELGPMQAIQYA